MRYVVVPLAFGLGVTAAVIKRDGFFELETHDGVWGQVRQHPGGQLRVGGDYPMSRFTLSNGIMKDQHGRGCVESDPQRQIQCDWNNSGQQCFGISQDGKLTFRDSTNLWACPVNDNGEWSIYTASLPGQLKCRAITIKVNGGPPPQQPPSPSPTPAPAPSKPHNPSYEMPPAGPPTAASSKESLPYEPHQPTIPSPGEYKSTYEQCMSSCKDDCENRCAHSAGHAGSGDGHPPVPPSTVLIWPTIPPSLTTNGKGPITPPPKPNHGFHYGSGSDDDSDSDSDSDEEYDYASYSNFQGHRPGHGGLPKCPSHVPLTNSTPPCYNCTQHHRPPPACPSGSDDCHELPPPCHSCDYDDNHCRNVCTVTQYRTEHYTQHHTKHRTATQTETSICTEVAWKTAVGWKTKTRTTTKIKPETYWKTCTERETCYKTYKTTKTKYCTETETQKQTKTKWSICTQTSVATKTKTKHHHHDHWHTDTHTCTETDTQYRTCTEKTWLTHYEPFTKTKYNSCYVPGRGHTCTITSTTTDTATTTATSYQPCYIECKGRPECIRTCAGVQYPTITPSSTASPSHDHDGWGYGVGNEDNTPSNPPVDDYQPHYDQWEGYTDEYHHHDHYYPPSASSTTTSSDDDYYNPYWRASREDETLRKNKKRTHESDGSSVRGVHNQLDRESDDTLGELIPEDKQDENASSSTQQQPEQEKGEHQYGGKVYQEPAQLRREARSNLRHPHGPASSIRIW